MVCLTENVRMGQAAVDGDLGADRAEKGGGQLAALIDLQGDLWGGCARGGGLVGVKVGGDRIGGGPVRGGMDMPAER